MKINTRFIEIKMAEQGLTQKALAENCGMAPTNFGRILRRGTCEPITVGKLARGLEVSVEEVISE